MSSIRLSVIQRYPHLSHSSSNLAVGIEGGVATGALHLASGALIYGPLDYQRVILWMKRALASTALSP
ncbi:hypothetical protein CHELA1G11_10169 [Hyphomicrobiales bacterium]|nr:hypothetical protein CHELA1G11_10169 [Hyphomicrobiales bacterium]CAH1676576.1 hypothetical protein CHELA1G2_14139 [Hyphomicrobiales bacterium]